jgi:hypothetical protein
MHTPWSPLHEFGHEAVSQREPEKLARHLHWPCGVQPSAPREHTVPPQTLSPEGVSTVLFASAGAKTLTSGRHSGGENPKLQLHVAGWPTDAGA